MKAQLRVFSLVAVCWQLPCVALQGAQTITTVHASPAVESTIAVVEGKLVALVLWRGRPGWTLSAAGLTQDSVHGDNRPGGFRNSGGGAADGTITVGIQRGAVSLDLSYNPRDGVVLFGGKTLRAPIGTNVILVDGADRRGDAAVAGFMIIDPGDANIDPRAGSLGPLLGRSPEVAAFLRCDAAVPQPKLPPDSPPGVKEMILRGMKGYCDDIPKYGA
jgi:hypothetical protein